MKWPLALEKMVKSFIFVTEGPLSAIPQVQLYYLDCNGYILDSLTSPSLPCSRTIMVIWFSIQWHVSILN